MLAHYGSVIELFDWSCSKCKRNELHTVSTTKTGPVEPSDNRRQ